MAAQSKLTERVASGVAWSIAEKVGSALLQAVVSIVVANRIVPMDMGIMAVLTVFISLAQLVVDSGFSQTLIRKSEPSEGDYVAVFRFNILSSVALYLLLTAVAPFVASYYGWPQLATVAPVLFLSLPLNALGVIQNTMMVRDMRFAELSTMSFISIVVSGLVAIAMAVAGMGIWALAGQRLSSMATKSALLWWHSNWRPRKTSTQGSLREMAPFSLRLMTTEIITSIYNNVSQLFIGKIYSGSALGCFNQAQKLVYMPYTLIQSIQSVTFPALSRIKDEEEKFAESYRLVVMATSMIMFPIMAGLIATAEDFYTLLLKPDWHPAIPYFRIMCIGGFFYPLLYISYNILKVKSDGAIILRLEVIKRALKTAETECYNMYREFALRFKENNINLILPRIDVNTDIRKYISEELGTILYGVLNKKLSKDIIQEEMHRYIPETKQSDKPIKQLFKEYFYNVVLYKDRKPGIYLEFDEHMKRVIVMEFYKRIISRYLQL